MKIQSFVEAIADICGPDNIIAASRVHGSVIVFLSHVTWVDSLCASGINVNGYAIHIEPLVKPATKVVISGVPPYIPDQVIENEISNFGKIVSGLRTISLGCKNENLKHVRSFRRQIYLLLDNDNNGLDGAVLNFNYDGRRYRVYLSTDEIQCFNCFEKGHIRRNCPKLNDQSETNDNSQQVSRNTADNESQPDVNTTTLPSPDVHDITDPKTNQINNDNASPETNDDITDKEDNANKKDNDTDHDKGDNANKNDNDTTDATSQNKQRKPKTITTSDATHDLDSEQTNDTMINNQNNDEERVLTPPSIPTPEPDPTLPPPKVSSTPSSFEMDLSGLPDKYNPNIDDDGEDTDDGSIASSDISDLLQMTDTHFDATMIKDFLREALNSKKFITKCGDFCPNLNDLAKQLMSYRSSQDLSAAQRARIYKYVVKIRAHIKTTGKTRTGNRNI
jgi:hypothetical protein